MAVSVNQILANTLGLADPLGRIADDGRVGFNGRVNINGRPIRFAPNFDGTDDSGVLASRAMNPDGDFDIQWAQSGVSLTGNRAIITQCDSATVASREINLRWLSGVLEFAVGGVTIVSAGTGIASQDGVWRIQYSGTTVNVFRDSNLIHTNNARTRGAAREPSAPTRIAFRNNGGVSQEFFSGILYNIRINGVTWLMDQRNQAIQPSTPAGNNMTLSNVAADRWQEVKQ